MRLIAVGDIHGHLTLLNDLMDQVAQMLSRSSAPQKDQWVFLGDYIDRGPNSAQVIDRLCEIQTEDPNAIFLLGNHEEILLSFLKGSQTHSMAQSWLMNGGEITADSYGVDAPDDPGDGQALERFRTRLVDAVPPHHLRFLKGLVLYHHAGDYIFVHAGLRPGVPLRDQQPEDMIWIRDRFLNAKDDFGGIVVHGHTPSPLPDIQHNRIGLDTGAGKGGYLTAGLFWSTERAFLHAYPDRTRP